MAHVQPSVARRTRKQVDPFLLGWRYVKRSRPNKNGDYEYDIVPLRDEDLLNPQEDDFIVHNDNHITDVPYLRNVFKAKTAHRPRIRIMCDHIIDFQHGGVQPLGPDITALEGEPLEWDGSRGTFPVKDMQSQVLFVLEDTSPSTRDKDVGPKKKLYYRAGVPLYIICDAPYGGARRPRGILPYQAGPEGYKLLPLDADGRFWIEAIGVFIGILDGRVVCFDKDGKRIEDYPKISAQLQQEKARTEQEKARADAAEARLRELEATAKQPHKRKK
jgi:Putative restriction endonuclease